MAVRKPAPAPKAVKENVPLLDFNNAPCIRKMRRVN